MSLFLAMIARVVTFAMLQGGGVPPPPIFNAREGGPQFVPMPPGPVSNFYGMFLRS